jgi:hypothetical protein
MSKLLSVLIAGVFAAVTFSAVAADAAPAKAAAPTVAAAPAAKAEGKTKAVKVAKHSTKHKQHSKKAADAPAKS